MRFDRYDNRAAQVAAALVTAARDGLTLAALRGVIEQFDLPLHVDPADLAGAVALADELTPLFGSPADATIAAIDDRLATLDVRPRLTTHDGRDPHLHFEPDGADTVTRLRVNSLMGLAAVVADAGPQRLGRCAAAGCEVVYVDVSRNGRRRFCSTACANRTHVAEHRARQRPRATRA
ncbi:CGNR zinc finger domain-containing protein [Egicoccus sp. AB-alg2]|uniref:CGNR zinc finger domain-containing protein n=1 Tax=Egicoccus sp. AB-alg2 TaxID=3242693 RepID=UPI00359E076A